MDRIDSDSKSPSKREGRRDFELNGRLDASCSRMKMRDLHLVLRSEEITDCHLKSPIILDATFHASFSKNEEDSLITDTVHRRATGKNAPLLGAAACLNITHVEGGSGLAKCQSKIHEVINDSSDSTSGTVSNICEQSSLKTIDKKDLNLNILQAAGLALDLSAENDMLFPNPFFPCKNLGHMKSRELSECGSNSGPLEETEPLRMWNAMKQNGFLSSSYGGIPIPKQKGPSKKRKSDTFKKKIELAKREQVSRFTKIAAPSGLLSGLNPGVINHVRNSKQVHSIIEALVRSEKPNDQTQKKQVNQIGKEGRQMNSKGENSNHPEYVNGAGSKQAKEVNPSSMNRASLVQSCSESRGALDASEAAKTRFQCAHSVGSHFISEMEDERLKLKLCSTSEKATLMPNEELSASQDNISSLSVKAATIASQWLELLDLDIRGRLAALKRSRKRVRTMVRTELPSLVSQEFASNQENDPCFAQPLGSHSMHMGRWRSLFSKMEKALSEEGKHMESWLRQVQEMKGHCVRGLQIVNLPNTDGSQQLSSSDTDSRLHVEAALERESAIRAAAASIYSTCNLVMAAENVPCF